MNRRAVRIVRLIRWLVWAGLLGAGIWGGWLLLQGRPAGVALEDMLTTAWPRGGPAAMGTRRAAAGGGHELGRGRFRQGGRGPKCPGPARGRRSGGRRSLPYPPCGRPPPPAGRGRGCGGGRVGGRRRASGPRRLSPGVGRGGAAKCHVRRPGTGDRRDDPRRGSPRAADAVGGHGSQRGCCPVGRVGPGLRVRGTSSAKDGRPPRSCWPGRVGTSAPAGSPRPRG